MSANFLSAALLAALAVPAFGACTFDFAAASARLYGESSGGGLLQTNAWRHSVWMSSYGIKRTDPRWKAVAAGVRPSSSGGEYVTENPRELLAALDGSETMARIAMSSWGTTVILPDAEGGRYRLSFLYAMSHSLGDWGVTMIVFYKGAKSAGTVRFALANIDACETTFSRTVVVPKGVTRLLIDNRLQGLGKLRFWKPSLRKLPAERPVELRVAATGWFAPDFELARGQGGTVCWHWKRGYGTGAESLKGMTGELTVPKDFRLEGVSFGTVAKDVRAAADGSRVYRIAPAAWLLPRESFSEWHRIGVTLSSDASVGTRGTLRFVARAKDGAPLSDEARTELVVTEPVRAPMPKRFTSGIVAGGAYWRTADDRGLELFARQTVDAGFNGIFIHGLDRKTAAAFRAAGVKEILQGSSRLTNGFCIGPEKGRPESDRYVFRNGRHPYPSYTDRSACPISVSGESEFFRTVTVPWLKDQIGGSGADALWTNWEPYSYAGQGCMCAKCRAAFAQYVGVTDAEMAKDWPRELAFGGKWHDRIERFRSVEHGKMVRTLLKYGDIVFGIFWGELSSAWRPRNLAAEVQAIDYAGALRTICAWGPYPTWDTLGAYMKADATCLETFCAAKDVRAQVNRDYPAAHRPRLMAFPSGCSFGCDWVGQPEWLFLQTACFFLNGWESSYLCGFPRGYDARHWRAMAEANAIAAKWEDYVYDGTRCDGKVKLSSRRPFRSVRNVSSYLDWTRDGVPVVQSVAYARGGRTLVAIFNFSEDEAYDVDVALADRTVERNVRLAAPSLVIREY